MGAGPGSVALRPGGAGWPRPRRRGGRSRNRPGCRRAGCRPRASRSAPGPGRGPGRPGRSTRSSAGSARGRPGRAPRASWWRPTGSSRRTARCPGPGRRRSGAPRRPRGRRSRWSRAAAGGRRSPRRSSPPPAPCWPACTAWGCWPPAGRRRSAARISGGQAVGDVLGQGAGDQAEGALGLPVGELVRAGLPVLGHAEPGLVGGGQGDQRVADPGQVRGPVIGLGQHHPGQQGADAQLPVPHPDRQHGLDPGARCRSCR